MVKRRQLRLAQALHDSKHRCIDETDAQVGVGREQLSNPCVVGHLELDDLEGTPTAIFKKRHEGVDLRCSIQQMLNLDQRRCRHDPLLTGTLEQLGTRDVVVIARLDSGESNAGI
jgi:hypothetical protein